MTFYGNLNVWSHVVPNNILTKAGLHSF